MRNVFGIAFLLLFGCATTWAKPCELKMLPEAIQTSLATDYAGWRPVTPNMLESSDRQTWIDNYSRECPGIIKGRFTDTGEGYVINLLNVKGGKTRQQVVYFQEHENEYTQRAILKPQATSIVLVLRLFAPGKYRDLISGQSLTIATDTIGLSQIDAGTVVYYWDGAAFRRIVTSE